MDPQQLAKLLDSATKIAEKYKNFYTTQEHILYALLDFQEIKEAFRDLDIPIPFIREQLEKYFSNVLERAADDKKDAEIGKVTNAVHTMMTKVIVQSMSSGRPFPREIDIILYLCKDEDSFAANIFKAIGLKPLDVMKWASNHPKKDNPFSIKDIVVYKIGNHPKKDSDSTDDDDNENPDFPFGFNPFEAFGDEVMQSGEEDNNDEDNDNDDDKEDSAFKRIKPYVTRLVRLARDNKIDPVIGRDREIRTCCQVLLKRTKCNVLIVGEAGVGKTAIVEGLARSIANGDAPTPLFDTEIYSIDIPSLMSGTKYRGEMESRLKSIIKYVKNKPNSILFIDELHSAAGTDKSGGSQEILTLLKPELAKGSLRLIGTTTYEDFRKSLSQDSALLRRFHKLDIDEPDESTTRQILKELSTHYADFHQVEYDPEALDAAVKLAARYLPERRFPDKAIDIIDEAGAANRMLPLGDQVSKIGVHEVEAIITNVARIPDLHVSADESSALLTADKKMREVIFGQDKAIETVIHLVKLSRAGIRAPQKTVASLLFAGPTGVGKTEVARQLARVLSLPFVRFDMSEYREEYTISKFIGSAPGYVGYERGGLLTEAIRSKPNCVLLLDEIEKAHPSIYDLLLQVMDVARLTDNTGKSADFRNVILIMTSNAGSEDMNRVRIGFGNEIDVTQGMKEIEKTFSPEFRNRLDDIVLFNALASDQMVQIARKMVRELETQLAEKNIHLILTDEACAWLAEHGYDARYGARPMARLIQSEIALPLSDIILFGRLKNGGNAKIVLKTDKSGLNIEE